MYKNLKWSKYATFNFAYQHISLQFKFVAYPATLWTVKKKHVIVYKSGP